MTTYTVEVPTVPYGPVGVPAAERDAKYYREAARNIRHHASRGNAFAGSNLTETVAQLCDAAAEALEGHPFRSTGAELILAERERQVFEEGYTAEHDAGHAAQLIAAGIAYANAADAEARWPEMGPAPYPVDEDTGAVYFPWAPAHWKPTGDPVRDLTKAGALIAAAIDSLAEVTR